MSPMLYEPVTEMSKEPFTANAWSGDVVPTPRNPADVMVVVPVAPKYAALKTANGEEVAAATALLTVR